MEIRNFLPLIFLFVILGCGSSSNDAEFIEKSTGRYMYNSDEVIEVYFEDKKLFLKWRGADAIQPLKTDDGIFYVKEMNKKIQFISNPKNNHYFIGVVPVEDVDSITFDYRKMDAQEKVPGEYLALGKFENALEAYRTIKNLDSLDPAIEEDHLNSFGYRKLRNDELDEAIQIFKINVALYPESANVYDSLGEAYLKSGDTVQAILNYKKNLTLDSANTRAKRMIERLEKKD